MEEFIANIECITSEYGAETSDFVVTLAMEQFETIRNYPASWDETKKQIFGQMGLDHGPEWYSAKITNLSTEMPTNNDMARRVFAVPSATYGAVTGNLEELTVNSVAGTETGNTKITVSPELISGNSYKYKIGDSAQSVTYGKNVQTWTAWDGSSDITAETGKVITIVECDSAYHAVKAGNAVVTANA